MAPVYGARDDRSAPGDRSSIRSSAYLPRDPGRPTREQRWNVYTISLVAFSVFSFLAVYLLMRLQAWLPFNPTDRSNVSAMGAFSGAVSFMTNTNWQWFSGEQTISHLTQMVGFTVQNFVSAAAGMAVAVGLIRGITRTGTRSLGNFGSI